MFRRVALIWTVLFAGMLLPYALSPATERADLAYVNASGINTLDPAAITWKQDIRVAQNAWEGLTSFDPEKSQVVAGAAEWPEVSNDGLRYTFEIRPDARWSNGDRVTADDFVRGWRRAIEPGTAGDFAFFILDYVAGAREYYTWRNEAVANLTALSRKSDAWRTRFDEHAGACDARFAKVGINASNPQQFEVTLARPCPYFLDLCAFVTLVPIHESIELLRVDFENSGITAEGLVAYDPQWTKPDYRARGYPGLITNGPFIVERWEFKKRLRMIVNPHYRDAAGIACRKIDMMVYADLNTAIMAYEAGDLDFLPEAGVTYEHELARLAVTGERPDFHCPPVFGTYYYLFNCADDTINGKPNPFVDARVRRAFAMAIDRPVIAERVAGRGEQVTGSVVPPRSIDGYTPPAGLSFDPSAARRLLASAGYPSGDGLPAIDLLYNTGHQHGKVCEVLAEMWREHLGAVVVPRGKEVKTFAEDRKNGRFMIARAGWYGDYADPTTFLDVFAAGNGNNDSRHADIAFDDLLERAANTIAPPARLQLLAEAESRLVTDTVPVLPLFQYTQLLAIKPRITGLTPNPRLIFQFKNVSVTP